MKIAVIIVTFNPEKWIEKCFSSIRNSNLELKTIVIDNNSSDNSTTRIKELYPEVTLLELDKNLGFGQANNIGIKKAYDEGANYFFLLNQDAWIQQDTVGKLITAHQKQKQFGILSPMHLNGNGDALDYNFSIFASPSRCKKLFSDIFLDRTEDKIYKTDFINAAAWLISRDCIEKVGGFSPVFFHYGEDDNYCQRVRFHKLSIGILPNAKIYHDRENRNKNLYFNDKKIAYQRHILLKASNVFSDFSFKHEYLKCYMQILKSGLLFRLQDCLHAYSKLRILNSIDKNHTAKNKMITKIPQKSFL